MNNRKTPLLAIVVPCYNEQQVLPIASKLFIDKIKELIFNKEINKDSFVLFVDDGSKDKTWQIIKELSSKNVKGISLSRNRGHQNALLAGLLEIKEMCDITVSIDCDGQDDINAINEMVEKYKNGDDIVYGVRSARKTDTFFKKFTAESFYRLLDKFGVETIFNHADYRLMSSRVLNEFANYEEVNLFLRGMVPLVGFKSSIVYYERKERMAGESHYPLIKMIELAINGITSLSIKPISIIAIFGIVFIVMSLILLIIVLITTISNKLMYIMFAIICLLLSFVIFFVGVLGEYVGKTYIEAKHRPRYIVSERTH